MKKSPPSQDSVLEFIHRRFPIDSDWVSGNCYYFAVILRERFGGEIYYDPVNGHFFLKKGSTNYDYEGIYVPSNEYRLEDIRHSDPIWYSRLVSDCIE